MANVTKSISISNSRKTKPKVAVNTPHNVNKLIKTSSQLISSQKTRSMKNSKGGFGTLDPLLAAAFLAGVRMSMNQKNKLLSSQSAKKNTKSKRS
jgi:hypothetical protein